MSSFEELVDKVKREYNLEWLCGEHVVICLLAVCIGYWYYYDVSILMIMIQCYGLSFSLGIIGVMRQNSNWIIAFQITQFLFIIAFIIYGNQLIWLWLDPPHLRLSHTEYDKQINTIVARLAMLPALVGFYFIYVVNKYRLSLN